jgi:hypothetical protein
MPQQAERCTIRGSRQPRASSRVAPKHPAQDGAVGTRSYFSSTDLAQKTPFKQSSAGSRMLPFDWKNWNI